MIKKSEALKIIDDVTPVMNTEKLELLSSLGKVLSENIYAYDYLPPFNKSAMDGYAIKSNDTKLSSKASPTILKIAGTIKAGEFQNVKLKSGEAYKIMTGAPVPQGADAVVEIEVVDDSMDQLKVYDPIKKGRNIIFKGEEIQPDQMAIPKGKEIRPVEIGLLASLGHSKVNVYRAPRIALIVTGDELIDIDAKLDAGKIRNSNEYSIKALVQTVGAKMEFSKVVADDRDQIQECMEEAVKKADIILTSGGASVGDYDFMDDIITDIGASIKFNAVAIKPGKPVTFATYEDKLIFSLPGNPSSIITAFETFVKPAIEKAMGKGDEASLSFPVIITEDIKGKPGREKHIYASISRENDGFYASSSGMQCSNHLLTMSRSNGVVVVPAQCGSVQSGDVLMGHFLFQRRR